MTDLPRVRLIQHPTPLHRLANLSAQLGFDLWIKRDDLTGFAFGGNKGRKLEYLIADALRERAEVIVTCGALQSNFIRQLGAACAMHGLGCVAVTMRLPFDRPAGQPPIPRMESGSGNALLDRILGVDLQVVPDDDWEALYEAAEAAACAEEAAGRRVYRIPVGGSSPLGAYAFYQAGREVVAQLHDEEPFDSIVFASSSGSTQTGLAYAFADTRCRVLGICSDPEPSMVEYFAEMGQGLAPLVGSNRVLEPSDFHLNVDHVGAGYGVPSGEAWNAIRLVARTEGIFLDPIYTGKAFAGLIELASKGAIGGRVLFWHTGGVPALFAYGQ